MKNFLGKLKSVLFGNKKRLLVLTAILIVGLVLVIWLVHHDNREQGTADGYTFRVHEDDIGPADPSITGLPDSIKDPLKRVDELQSEIGQTRDKQKLISMYGELASIYAGQNRSPQAESAYKMLISYDSQDGINYLYLARVYKQEGRKDQARIAYNKCLTMIKSTSSKDLLASIKAELKSL